MPILRVRCYSSQLKQHHHSNNNNKSNNNSSNNNNSYVPLTKLIQLL